MGTGLLAEASPCCPSPLFGQLVAIAYIVGGGLAYLWLMFAAFKWLRGRYHRRTAT